MAYSTTTDLDKVLQGEQFTWGEDQQIYKIGPYTIIEYHPWKRQQREVLVGEPDHSVLLFHCYVDGKDTSRGAPNLSAALAECIALKHDGPNTQAAYYFLKMIGAPIEE